ncbi:hypothetical protein L211DRAFT_871445 [Terfezia boudieri ATCC MYA-4762]|uniref:Uncharacterized protein n=1 Tax=Terfezia boudieri ATCC MYA-4762 TaxID=1051890 RepID=A0A3N4LER6_9PEZI|nr:hypothetical protein L211DRAFT_871445 [Terfezia boudieri ATCC MYA-4762]
MYATRLKAMRRPRSLILKDLVHPRDNGLHEQATEKDPSFLHHAPTPSQLHRDNYPHPYTCVSEYASDQPMERTYRMVSRGDRETPSSPKSGEIPGFLKADDATGSRRKLSLAENDESSVPASLVISHEPHPKELNLEPSTIQPSRLAPWL